MDLQSLENSKGARHARKRLGRGHASGKGKTSGKGHKGQMARKGHKHKPGFEGGQMRLVRRIPKFGFKNPARIQYLPVNVSALDCFEDGSEITEAILREKGLVNGSTDGVKILGSGKISKKLTIKVSAFSASAKTKVEAVGGTCEVVGK